MKIEKIFKILLFLFLISCNKIENQSFDSWVEISKNLQYQEQKDKILLKSGKFHYQFQKNKIPFQRIMVLNTTLLGFVTELGQENRIIGIAGTQYVSSEKVKNLIKLGQIQEVGREQKYDVEKIIALKPDVIFTNYMVSFENTYHILRKNGIEVVFLDDYLEQNPLEKAAYLKLLGVFLGVKPQAEKIYTEIEHNYKELTEKVQKVKKSPKVLVGEMYGNHWFMAGGKSYVAHYLQDANVQYLFKNIQDEKAVPLSFEEVFVKSQEAKYWVNLGNYKTKKELLAMNPSYEKLPVFKSGKIYSMTKRQKGEANDVFEQGSVRVDWILRDYIKIFHPELLPQDTLLYMRELK